MSINPSLGRAKLKRHSICFSWRRNFSPIVCCNPFVLRKGCKINIKVSRFNMSMAAPTIYFRPRLRWRRFSVWRHFRQHVGEEVWLGFELLDGGVGFYIFYFYSKYLGEQVFSLSVIGCISAYSCLFFYLKKNLMR